MCMNAEYKMYTTKNVGHCLHDIFFSIEGLFCCCLSLHLGLLRLQSIFEKQGFKNDSIRVRVMKRISSVMDALSIIRNIEVAQR